ncbi:MAG: EndoU domain-containing protein [Candidatus Saccharibacteria bacterium]|nr:EndoU domain-containing protein [Candidatus Saccharibacteria bacterium]
MGVKPTGSYSHTIGATKAPPSLSGKSVATLPLKNLNHANQGDFNKTNRPVSGGHGQANINKLQGTRYEPEVTKTYPNGVRLGKIPNHKNPKDRVENGHAWFPSNWTEGTIKAAASYIAKLKGTAKVPDGEKAFGTYKGVRIGIIIRNGKIETVFPDFEQPTKSNKKGRKK